jgi:hypothetical protein
MKLDEDPFPMNMNIVQLEGKNVIIQPSQAESTKGKDVVVGEERQPRMIKPKSPKHDKWKKNERNKPQFSPKATFDIIMAKYREGRASIKECKIGPSSFPGSGQYRSKAPPRQNSEGWDHHQRECHLTPYHPVGPPMLGPWVPLSMIYPPSPPWAGWYGPWAPPLLHFHPGWSRQDRYFDHRGYHMGDDRYGSFDQ